MNKHEAKISEIKEKIVQEIQPEKIILFGSYAWGKPTAGSDVDLFIIKETTGSRRKKQMELRKKLFHMGVPMDIIIYTPKELEYRLELKDFFFEKIMNEGKLLYAK